MLAELLGPDGEPLAYLLDRTAVPVRVPTHCTHPTAAGHLSLPRPLLTTPVSTGRNTHQRDKDRERIRRTGAACGICGEPIDYTLPYLHPREFVVDHIIPLSKRPDLDVLSNKQAAHRDCNRAKGARDHAPIVRRSGSLT